MMVWFACIRHASRARTPLYGFSSSPPSADAEKTGDDDADFAMRVWMETLAIEEALNAHTCDTEQAFMYQVCSCR